MLIHDDINYKKTGWEARLAQLVNNDKDPGLLYAIVKKEGLDHDGMPATVLEVYCERAILVDVNGDTWVVADAESTRTFFGTTEAFGIWTSEEISRVTNCSVAAINTTWPHVFNELLAVGQGSVRSQAAAIGTIAVETGTFTSVRESYWESEAWRKENLRYYPYYGRGLIQLTWDYNYITYGNQLGVDLYNYPELALEPLIAAKVFAKYWMDRNIQEPSDREDWAAVRKKVQGGSVGLSRLIDISTQLIAIAKIKGKL
jgi:predicted chitinase